MTDLFPAYYRLYDSPDDDGPVVVEVTNFDTSRYEPSRWIGDDEHPTRGDAEDALKELVAGSVEGWDRIEREALAAFTGVPVWVTDTIAAIEVDQAGPAFIATRWPFTYAYDYVRSHTAEFGITGKMLARSEVPPVLRLRLGVSSPHPLYQRVCERLAQAYCREHRIQVPADVLAGR